MSVKRLYIQQSSFDGITYKKGIIVDTFATYHVAIRDIPYRHLPEIKELPKRDWKGSDGVDVYIPHPIPIKDYDMEISMLYMGDEDNIKNDLHSFIDFLYGRNVDATGGRLFVYDEYTQTGRKDVYVESVLSDEYYVDENDPDALCLFKIKFHISDPTTEIKPIYSGGIITDLTY